MLWEAGDGPSLPFFSPHWETGFEMVVGAGPSAVMTLDVGVVSAEIIPIRKSIMT